MRHRWRTIGGWAALVVVAAAATTLAVAQQTPPAETAPAPPPPAAEPSAPVRKDEAVPAATEPSKPAAARGSPQRFEPTEKVRADFDVAFPIDI